MELKDLKLGDIVALNSASPKMTVIAIDGNYVRVVFWNFNLFKMEELNTIAEALFKP